MIFDAIVMMALAQAPTSSATLSGQVVDAEGRPAAGIEVMLSGLGRGVRRQPVLSRAKSDREGRFRIDVPAEKDPAARPVSPDALGLRPGGGASRAGVLAVGASGGRLGKTEAGRPGAHVGSSGGT